MLKGFIKEEEFYISGTFDDLISVRIVFDCGTVDFMTRKGEKQTLIFVLLSDGGDVLRYHFNHEPVTTTEGEEIPLFDKFVENVGKSAVFQGLVFSLKSMENVCRDAENLTASEKARFFKEEFTEAFKKVVTAKGEIKEIFYKLESWVHSFGVHGVEERLKFFLDLEIKKNNLRIKTSLKTTAKAALSETTGRDDIQFKLGKKGRGKSIEKVKHNMEDIRQNLREAGLKLLFDREQIAAKEIMYILTIAKLIQDQEATDKGMIAVKPRDFLKNMVGVDIYKNLSENQKKDEIKNIINDLLKLSEKKFNLRNEVGGGRIFNASSAPLFTFRENTEDIEHKKEDKNGKEITIITPYQRIFIFEGFSPIAPPAAGRGGYWEISLRVFRVIQEGCLTNRQKAAAINTTFAIMADMDRGQRRVYKWSKMTGLKRFRDEGDQKEIKSAIITALSLIDFRIKDEGKNFSVESAKK